MQLESIQVDAAHPGPFHSKAIRTSVAGMAVCEARFDLERKVNVGFNCNSRAAKRMELRRAKSTSIGGVKNVMD